MASKNLRIVVTPIRVTAMLCGIFLALFVAHSIGLFMTYGLGHDYVKGLVPLFNIGLEGNVPTFFASLLLFFNGLLFLFLWQVSGTGETGRKTWLLLSVVFVFLSLDEFASIHELLIRPVREVAGTGGLLYFAWVIPYALLVVVLGIIVAPTLWRLGSRYRILFGTSAAIFLGGAIGVEMLGGNYFESQDGEADLNYRLFQTAEESLEFFGLIFLVYTLLDLVRARAPRTQINIEVSTAR
ncbi:MULTISPECIES: hypothetical protein [Marinobacter]|uniref:hypothetical protein n=1 Tax=Marinobacter TaxID=2742 RepID=UPI001248F9F4|nr:MULTISPECIES: hypothetical protein [Marinobacter]MBL3556736.1 hypothetical protein [Marinobacter sp. JB05H06]